jgi:hypothetical protein
MKSNHSQNEKRQIARFQAGVETPVALQQMMLALSPQPASIPR